MRDPPAPGCEIAEGSGGHGQACPSLYPRHSPPESGGLWLAARKGWSLMSNIRGMYGTSGQGRGRGVYGSSGLGKGFPVAMRKHKARTESVGVPEPPTMPGLLLSHLPLQGDPQSHGEAKPVGWKRKRKWLRRGGLGRGSGRGAAAPLPGCPTLPRVEPVSPAATQLCPCDLGSPG